jgi:hypothetical protein
MLDSSVDRVSERGRSAVGRCGQKVEDGRSGSGSDEVGGVSRFGGWGSGSDSGCASASGGCGGRGGGAGWGGCHAMHLVQFTCFTGAKVQILASPSSATPSLLTSTLCSSKGFAAAACTSSIATAYTSSIATVCTSSIATACISSIATDKLQPPVPPLSLLTSTLCSRRLR